MEIFSLVESYEIRFFICEKCTSLPHKTMPIKKQQTNTYLLCILAHFPVAENTYPLSTSYFCTREEAFVV